MSNTTMPPTMIGHFFFRGGGGVAGNGGKIGAGATGGGGTIVLFGGMAVRLNHPIHSSLPQVLLKPYSCNCAPERNFSYAATDAEDHMLLPIPWPPALPSAAFMT